MTRLAETSERNPMTKTDERLRKYLAIQYPHLGDDEIAGLLDDADRPTITLRTRLLSLIR